MSITVAQAVAKIDADDSGLKSRFEGIKGKLGEAGGWFSNFSSTMAGVFSGQTLINGVTAIVHGLGDMVKEGQDANLGIAQTGAVLKSTGGAAGVTADMVSQLADKYMNMTGIQDDTVRSAENMLLTFTGIGKDVFPQATKTVLDMSTALGQDTKNSAIQLGKALNDPVNGITALQRVGVTFNDTQKNLIKTYVEHGDKAKAQGVILQELNKEFGGSADAAGQANGGIKILSAQFDNMKQEVGQAVIPILGKLFTQVQPLIQQFAQWLPGALDKASKFINDNVMPVVKQLGEWFVNQGLPALKRFGDFIMSNVVPTLMRLNEWFQAHVVPILQTLWNVIINNVLPALAGIWSHIQEKLIPAVQKLWEKLEPVLKPALEAIGWVLQNVLGPALGFVIDVISSMIDTIADLIGKLEDAWNWISQVFGAKSPMHSKGFGGVTVHGPDGSTKSFASGGDMPTSGLAMVGEAGPELVYMPAGAHVFNARETAGMFSGGTGGRPIQVTIPVHIAGRHVTDVILPDFVKAVREATGARSA